MRKLIEWHKNYYYNLLEKWNVTSYQIAWLAWFKGLVIGFIIMTLCGCGTYQLTPVDECCETEVVYLDEVKGDSVNIFTSLDFNTITFKFKPRFYRGSDFYWGNTYSYWGMRPLWMDFNNYGNYYSFNSPYYSSFYRPWNYWDYYMRPWMPSNNWNQGPFNNQGYNVAYNSSRRSSLTESNRMSIKDKIAFGKMGNSRLVQDTNKINRKPVIKKPIIYKPLNNRPSYNFKPINNIPVYNNIKPVINNSKPNFNRPRVINNNVKSTRNNSKPSIRTIKNDH